jgi:hypothetical protein
MKKEKALVTVNHFKEFSSNDEHHTTIVHGRENQREG